MKQFLVLSVFSFLALNASADGFHHGHPVNQGTWLPRSEMSETANGPAQFRSLQRKYPELFAMIDADTVVSAYVHSYIYQWDGPTRCRQGDPRLFHPLRYYRYCQANGCNGGESSFPPNVDPCSL